MLLQNRLTGQLTEKLRYTFHAYLLLKERLSYLAKCFHDMMILFVGFDELGNGNQEVSCNPLYHGSLEIRCRFQSAYIE
jgi:hypothetical protein